MRILGIRVKGSKHGVLPPADSSGPGPTLVGQQLVGLKDTICEQTSLLSARQFSGRFRGLILTGSLARNEATFVEEQGEWTLLGDAEFLVVLDQRTDLPSVSVLELLQSEIQDQLLDRGVACRIELNAIHPTHLRKLKPHIFAYELRTCGQVVCGDPEILSLIPGFSIQEIPREDAWRLLCNRMIEMLEVAAELEDDAIILPRALLYRTIKLYLDMATSYLLFAGSYAPSYKERAEKLRVHAEEAPLQECPFPLRSFSERVSVCTRFKLLGRDRDLLPARDEEEVAGRLFWEEGIQYTCLLWRWELMCLTATSAHASNGKLQERWMQLQPVHQRLRGWLSLLRRCGWHRSWQNWPRWGRRAWRASPRYWLYAAASELFHRLPFLLVRASPGPETDMGWEELRDWLPVSRSEQSGSLPSWQMLASDIVWNYHEFLEKTRA